MKKFWEEIKMKKNTKINSETFILENNIELINKNINDLYNKYAKNEFESLTSNTDKSIASIAAKLGYRPAVNKAAFFLSSSLSIGSYFDDPERYPKKSGVSNDSTKSDVLCEAVIEQIFVPFLKDSSFSDQECFEIMDRVFEIYYFRENVTDFSYGAAQKWVNMAIKYYIILQFKKSGTPDIVSYIKLKYSNYNLFPIDGQMIQKIHKHFGDMEYDHKKVGCSLPTPQPWTNCNLKFTFIDYWSFVSEKLSGTKPILYEMANWNPES